MKIKFKAKNYEDEWVYGLPYSSDYSGKIDQIVDGENHIDIKPKTVCIHSSQKTYTEKEVLEQLNLLHSMKNSLIDTFTDKNDYITKKWFEQNGSN